MNETEKLIKEILKNRQSLSSDKFSVHFDKRFAKFVRLFKLCILLYIAYSIPAIYHTKETEYLAILTFAFLMVHFLEKSILLSIENPPNGCNDVNEWLFTQGRRKIFFELLFAFSFLITYLLYAKISHISTYGFIITFICFFSNVAMVYITSLKPRLFFSGFWVGLGQSLLYIAFFFVAWIIVFQLKTKYTFINNFAFLFSVFYFLLALLGLIFSLSDNKINYFQMSVLKFVRPQVILSEIIEQEQLYRLKIEAFELLNKTFKKNEKEKEIILLSVLNEKYNKKEIKFIGLLTAVIIFILGAIGEGFFQDLIYLPILKPLLCQLKILQC